MSLWLFFLSNDEPQRHRAHRGCTEKSVYAHFSSKASLTQKAATWRLFCLDLFTIPLSTINLSPMAFTVINPKSLGTPSGYSNGLLTDTGGKLLFIAGQIAWDEKQKIVSDDFVEQFDKALENVVAVLNAAGGAATDIVRLVIYVTNKIEYRERTREVGKRYQKHMDRHFPAMVLVQVAGLLDDAAKVEIEGMAVLPA